MFTGFHPCIFFCARPSSSSSSPNPKTVRSAVDVRHADVFCEKAPRCREQRLGYHIKRHAEIVCCMRRQRGRRLELAEGTSPRELPASV
jgi:hypothetical protein